jgi:hypothetical protein
LVEDLNIKPTSKFCNHQCYAKYVLSHPDQYKQSEERKQKQSNDIKKRISEGIFKPKTNNAYNGSLIRIDDKTFRSSWEAAFHILNPTLQYETVVIQYILDGVKRNYFVDFVDYDNRILYEIKPKSRQTDEVNILKEVAAIEWCKNNNYSLITIDETYLQKVLPVTDTSMWPDIVKRRLKCFLK